MAVVFDSCPVDACPVDASLLGVRDREEGPADYPEAARAAHSARLVVDTGRYAQGGIRLQAVGFMVGRLEIQRLRVAAAVPLGEAFDVKTFHDVVLGAGPLPMGVGGEVVQVWAGGRP